MTLEWMLGAVAAGALLDLAALAADRIAAWFRLPRRWIWAAAMAGSLLLPGIALAAPGALPRLRLPSPPAPIAPQPLSLATPAAAPGGWWDAPETAPPRPLPTSMLGGWLAVSLAIVAALAMGQRRLRTACGALESREVDGVRIFVAERAGPMVLGMLRPRIVLPRWAVDGPADELRLIARHEREHVRAGDPWLLAFSALAVAVTPWSIALWWQHLRLRLAVETDCDARVLAVGESTQRYGRVLLRTASRGTFITAGALAWGGRWSHLERRILAMTAQPPRNRFARALPLAGISLALAAVACGVASRGAVDAASPDVSYGVQEEQDGRLSGTYPLDDKLDIVMLGPDPAEGTVGLAWRYGDVPRTRNSPPPTVLPTVTRVEPGSPAAAAGLRVGDVIVSSNGRDAREAYMFGDKRPGTSFTLRIRRGGAERDVRLVVGPPPSRAEVERHMEEVVACQRRVWPMQEGQMDPCVFPY